jgi:hypothetical protein
MSVQFHAPAIFPPEKDPRVTHLVGGWVDPRNDMDVDA